nr:hypothetical protein [uncultured Anaerostipes sp.]
MQMAETCLRILILGMTYVLINITFLDTVLIKKKRTILFVFMLTILWMTKTLVLEYVMGSFWGDQLWFQCLKLSYITIHSTLVYIILAGCMYSSSVLKTGLAQIVCEVNYCIIIGAVLIIFNYLENREELMGYMLPFMLPDLLLFPVTYGVVKIEIHFLKPLLSWIRVREVKYRKIGWVIVGGYFISGIISSFWGLDNGNVFIDWTVFPVFIVSVAGSIVGFLVFMRYRKKTEQANTFLYSQTAFMKNYFQLLRQQIQTAESDQKSIENEEMKGFSREKLWNYMENLKEKYEAIQAGIYCNDWLVDGVLYHMAEFCRENGIAASFYFQKYDRGYISEEDISEIIYQLLAYGVRESLRCREEKRDSRSLFLQAEAVRNQLILNASFCSVKSIKKLKRDLKRSLSIKIVPYHGEIIASEIKGEKKQISIQMQREK